MEVKVSSDFVQANAVATFKLTRGNDFKFIHIITK